MPHVPTARPRAIPTITEDERGILTPTAAASYLQIARGTLKNWVALRRIPFVRLGRLTRFRKTELDRFIAEHTIEAKE